MQEMLRENEVAGQLVGLRDHHQFAQLHQHQLQHQPAESGPYALERAHMQMPMLQPGHQLQSAHGVSIPHSGLHRWKTRITLILLDMFLSTCSLLTFLLDVFLLDVPFSL